MIKKLLCSHKWANANMDEFRLCRVFDGDFSPPRLSYVWYKTNIYCTKCGHSKVIKDGRYSEFFDRSGTKKGLFYKLKALGVMVYAIRDGKVVEVKE